MTNRIIKVLGWGQDTVGPANITAFVDSEQVFSGSVNLKTLSLIHISEPTRPY